MSLLKMACDTYENAEEKYAGVYSEGEKEPLAPVAHAITNAAIEITIDKNGRFVSATEVPPDDTKTIFPVTEKSFGRTSSPEPHPLCDQIQYLSDGSPEKKSLYLQQLVQWKNSLYSHPFINAIYDYVKNGTLDDDLKKSNLKKCEDKAFVRWRIIGVNGEKEACWKNRKLQNQFIRYIESMDDSSVCSGVCMVSGSNGRLATQHAKGIVSINGNAKLISANDNSNFTYRGRFEKDNEALTVGYDTSQKAHNALRWLIANQGETRGYGGRTFLCWTPEGRKLPKLIGCMMPMGMSIDSLPKQYVPSDYKKWLHDTLIGWKTNLTDAKNVVTVAFDAATTGRLSVTYYSELPVNDFLERIAYWDETCCFMNRDWGIQSPLLYDIVKYSYGTYRGNDFEVDDRLVKELMLRILVCRVEKVIFPTDIERALVKTANNLQLYDGKVRNKVLFTTCAVIKKYRFDHKKEEWDMSLEPERRDRSYQYGRLLAVLEREEDVFYAKDGESRETNAIRMQSVFVKRPQYATRILIEQIKKAYAKRLSVGSQVYYEKLIGEIMDKLSEFSNELDKPLEDTYLLGYYLQKNAFYNKTKDEEEN